MLLLWWYGTGLVTLLRAVRDHIRRFAHSLNLRVLTRYLFVPMYGYNDFASRAISFVVRLVQLVGVTMTTAAYIAVEFVAIVLWMAIPVLVLGNIVYQLVGLLWIPS